LYKNEANIFPISFVFVQNEANRCFFFDFANTVNIPLASFPLISLQNFSPKQAKRGRVKAKGFHIRDTTETTTPPPTKATQPPPPPTKATQQPTPPTKVTLTLFFCISSCSFYIYVVVIFVCVVVFVGVVVVGVVDDVVVVNFFVII